MNLSEVEAIVSGGESEQVEFKKTTGGRREAAETICGMLNGRGGFVLFGVTDRGEIRGMQITSDTMEDLVQELRRIEPLALLSPEVVQLGNGLCVVVIRVPGGGRGPYTYQGRPYVRQGPTTSMMSQEQYRQLLLEQMHPSHRWETQSAHGAGIADLDHSEITRTVEEGIRRGRLTEPGSRDPEAMLTGLGLIQGGQLLNAAIVLFVRADRVMPYYPQCMLRMARFRGQDKGEFIDSRQERGNAFFLLSRAQDFLRQHLPVAGRVVPHLFERVDDPLYPPEALREALANAFCHRDYAPAGGSVSIAIFDDRLEIASTGRLPFGLTPEQLRHPHTSQPWNPLVAGVFFRRGTIESWGRGTVKMTELSTQAGLAPPEFVEGAGEFIVRFSPRGYIPPNRISHDLSPLQQDILKLIAQRGRAQLAEILKDFPETPRRTIQDNLQALKEYGQVDSVGRGRGAAWFLKGPVDK